MTVTVNATLIEDMEGAGPTISGIGGGKGASLNTDIFIAGAQSVGRRSSNVSTHGFTVNTGGTFNLTGTNEHVKIALWVTHYASVTAAEVRVGSTTSNYEAHTLTASEYPQLGGWWYIWVEVDAGTDSGTPDFSLAAEFGHAISIAAVGGNADNNISDQVHHSSRPTMTWDGATGTFADFVSTDASNALGAIVDINGAFFLYANVQIGSSTATTFTDSGVAIIAPEFSHLPTTSTWTGIDIDLQNGSTVVTWTGSVYGASDPAGQTRKPDLIVTGTSGSADLSSNRFQGLRIVDFTDAVTANNCVFANCGEIDLTTAGSAGADIGGSTIQDADVAVDGYAVIWDVNADPGGELDNTTFIMGSIDHHAIYLGTNSPITVNFSGITSSEYGSTNNQDDSFFFVARTSGTVTINITNGTGNFSYKTAGATVVVNQTVSIEINGLTEGSRGVMIGDGGAEDGVELLAGYADSTGAVSGSFGGTTPQNVIVRARNGGIVNAVIQDDNGAFTDYTDAARESEGTDDVTFLPSSPATDDACYIGGIEQFAKITFLITTAGTTYVGTWEYWDGDSWEALFFTDGTNGFQITGTNSLTFTVPSNWDTTTINSQGPYYYVRFRVTTGGGSGPVGERTTLNDTVKYLPFDSTGQIGAGGLTVTAVWIEDTINP